MEYTFRAYKLLIPNWNTIKDTFFEHIFTMDIEESKTEGKYGFVEVNKEDDKVFGYFAQESIEDFVKYENKKPLKIEDYPWIRTVFIIDTTQLIIFVHKKRYSSKFLTHGGVLERLQGLLSKELSENVLLFPFYAGLDKENYKKVFYDDDNIVKEVKFSKLQGSLIVDGTQLHNPMKELDGLRADSHNRYDSKILKSAYLEANDKGNLSKSPTARAFLEGEGSVGDMIKYETKSGTTFVEFSKAQAKIKIDIDDEAKDIKQIYSIIDIELLSNKSYIDRFTTSEIDNISGIVDEADNTEDKDE
ncbi:hypothetical protein [Clostridium tagluense]|uniref:Uncharacterized protein n=1 Tax=Clostridium tagluense TaxID=360422 RepID=A0A401UTZ8_9CLOT|nr:hypothetical protein [Clostridium tagluense]GCD12986.1 hypothetical protein Ctaglu_46090 [Clostridium tagluense]